MSFSQLFELCMDRQLNMYNIERISDLMNCLNILFAFVVTAKDSSREFDRALRPMLVLPQSNSRIPFHLMTSVTSVVAAKKIIFLITSNSQRCNAK